MLWKKTHQKKNDYSSIIGLNNTEELRFSSSGDFLLPVSRAILCFLLTVGSICGFASCFGAQFQLASILISLFSCSLIIAFVRNFHSKALKNICYVGFLFFYILFILRFYRYVNSGYHAIVNLTYASLENYLGIPALVHYEEIIENSYLTITFFLIFLGIFELLLYHMWIGEHINLLTIFLVSFGPHIVPLFINTMPENFYLACLLTAFIALIILRFGMHIHNHPRKNQSYSVYRKRNPWTFSIKGFSYGVSGINYFMSLFTSFLLSLCILLIVNTTIPYTSFKNNTSVSVLKQSVTEKVKYLVTFGLSGYFNRYTATGGLNEGQLGGIYSVRPDYETDLTVRYVPLSSQPLYLRGFVGIGYTDRQWYNADMLYSNKLLSSENYKLLCEDVSLTNEFSALKSQDILHSPYRLDVTNIGAYPKYAYAPYYTDPSLLEIYPAFADTPYLFLRNRTNTYTFYPDSSLQNSSVSVDIDSALLASYLQVPSDTRKEILKFLSKEGFDEQFFDQQISTESFDSKKTQAVLNWLSNCFSTEFTYSLNPGITPKDKDFAGYFLNESQKGFCAHFATSSVLILRTLGIPARYVEGYVLTSEELQNARVVENADISDFIPTSLVDMNLPVVDVDIADDKAHAWVEYYDPAFGWRVFEATTTSMDELSNLDFWSSIYNLFRQTPTSEEYDKQTGTTGISANSLSTVIVRVLIAAAALMITIGILIMIYRQIRLYRSYHRIRRNINVRNYYKIICRHIIKRYPEFDFILTFTEQFEFIAAHYKLSPKINPATRKKLSFLLEQAAFSNVEMSYSEYQYSMKLLKIIRRNIVLHF